MNLKDEMNNFLKNIATTNYSSIYTDCTNRFYTDTRASSIGHCDKLKIEKVTFNGPMTIVKWNDGKLTKVRKYDKDEFDPEKAVAMAIVKRLYGDNESSRYMREIKKFTENEKNYFNQPKKNNSKNK